MMLNALPHSTSSAEQPYSRVSCHLRARFRTVNLGEAQLHQRAPENPGVKELSAPESGISPALVKLLLNIDAKLDMLLGKENHASLQVLFPGEFVVTALGPEGFIAQGNSPLPSGLLEVVLLLDPGYGTASGIAQAALLPIEHLNDTEGSHCVLHHTNDSIHQYTSGMPQHLTGMTFQWVSIREGDHEELMRRIFQEERQKIRSARMDEDHSPE